MGLKGYKEKRNFRTTTKPVGESEAEVRGNTYLIHHHDASHLHWDLRLEMQGVLKSWAIPKEPPHEPGIKRLAVQVEDHPLEYANFSGIIPEGQYGAGVVEIWDKGTYTPIQVKEDKIVVGIHGKRLNGNYAIVRTKLGKGNNWLFFKMTK